MRHDLLAIGRANLDLYSQSVGAPFEEAAGFDAMVGGSPTNIAIGVSRLGWRSAIVTGVGMDTVGDFVIHQLEREGVDTGHVARIPGKLTSLALLGVQPPDRFPLTFYREDPADIHITPDLVDAIDFSRVGILEVSGNALARGTCVATVHRCIDLARDAGCPVYMDVDLRPSEWGHPAAYGEAIRSVLPGIDVLIGTEEEYRAAFAGSDDTSPLDEIVAEATAGGPGVVITKRGPRGATVRTEGESVDVPGYRVEVVNTVGAGDAFAAGLIALRLSGADWPEAVAFANACGAIVVTRHGCSAAFPTRPEVDAFRAASGSA